MKTVVDEIAEYLKTFGIVLNKKTIAEFKEKEKQQIIDAVTHGNRMEFYDATETAGEQYYNETFS